MSRPRAADSVQTHGRIVAAMRASIGETNKASMSLRAVARRAGVSLGTISYYFPTRAALLQAALEPVANTDVPSTVAVAMAVAEFPGR